jgi:predicted molibdopterin-dependent oxidoreductase YjgC
MSEAPFIVMTIDGARTQVSAGSSVAAAVMNAAVPARLSVSGQPRTALCGMGVCHECRVTIDGRAHQRACMTTVADGMVVTRDW